MSYRDLSGRREFQVLNDINNDNNNNLEELEMGIFDGFERAAVREYDDDKNDEVYRPQ